MAKKRAPKKTKEEKISENYFPINETDIKYSVEKTYKRPDPSSLEKVIGKTKKTRKKFQKKTTKKKTYKKPLKNIENFSPPNIKLKKSGYELIITEKPQAAAKISAALGNSEKKNLKGIPYYNIKRNGSSIVVACAVGHLFTLKQIKTGSDKPIFDIKWIPNFYVKKGDFTKKYHDTILSLAKNAQSLTIATDYDIEGEVIGLNIIRYICNQSDASRMKFSTLTKNELEESYKNKLPNLNWGQAIAGETRHYLDWFYGINLSRALMNAIKTTGKFKIMSIGRVQGPTLNLIVDKEKKIISFKSKPYWQFYIKIKDKNNTKIELKYNKDIFDKNLLKKFENLKNKQIEVKTEKKEQLLSPEPPFNLTTLQTEAYKHYGITPSETLRNAQSLYLAGLISYPRTSSQKLPESIGYKEILKKLAKEYSVESLIKKSKPIEGKKSDPAHPSIYPTAQYNSKPILAGNEEKIYELIVKRFLSLFCEDAIIEKKTISTEIDKNKFSAKGEEIKKSSWLKIYPSKLKEEKIPDINGKAEIIDTKTQEKETQPPKRYTPASIISILEKENLGTKATRSSILETLYERNYIKEKSIQATSLGISLIKTLEKYSPIIIDKNLTTDFEKQMELVRDSKSSEKSIEKSKTIISKAKNIIQKIFEDIEKNKKKIGQELLDANIKEIEKTKIENRLIKCPKCKKGYLIITYSKKTKRFFIGCDNYPDCTNTYTLPPNGIIKKTDKICEKCNFPMLMRLSKGKKPWIFCFNPECETNKEWVEKAKEKREEYLKENKKNNSI